MARRALLVLLTVLSLGLVAGSLWAKGPNDPLPVSKSDIVWGRADAPVTLFWFNDLECPYCGRAHTTVEDLQQRYGQTQLRIVHKQFPLPFHKHARQAAQLAVVVHQRRGMAAYERFITAVFADPKGAPADWFRAAQLSPSLAQHDGPAIRKRIDDDVAYGQRVGVKGTPAFFINGVRLTGARPLGDFVAVIDQELSETRRLRAEGVAKSDISRRRTQQNFSAPSKPKPKPGGKNDTTTVWKLPLRGDEPVRGPRFAPVTVVVFSEFECPFCAKVVPTLNALRTQYGNDLRLVFKHNPLPFHKHANAAAQLAIDAFKRRGNAGFWAAHDLLFAHQKALDDQSLSGYAQQLGLNPTATMATVKAGRYDKVIDQDQMVADNFKATGTPHFFINGRRLVGAQPKNAFVGIIDEELARAKKLRATGIPLSRLYGALTAQGKEPPPPPTKSVPAPGKDTPIRGNRYAPVTIQAFLDFECPYCARVQTTLKQLQAKYGTRVRIAFRHKPLTFHRNAPRAHNAAQEAFRQGGNAVFWKMHDLIWNQPSDLTRDTLIGYAKQLRLDVTAFTAAIDELHHEATIDADESISQKAGIQGTPSFVINDFYLSGAQPVVQFERLIDRALQSRRKP